MKSDTLLDEGLRRWIIKVAYSRAWQLPDYEPEDLIQEGYFCYAKCKSKYAHNFAEQPTKGDRKWFMSLVQRTFNNHLTSLVRKQMRKAPLVSVDAPISYEDGSVTTVHDKMMKDGRNVDFGLTAFVDIMLSAPVEVIEVLNKILIDGQDVLTVNYREAVRLRLEGPKQKRLRYIETTNEQLCKLVGEDPKNKNLHKEILALLKNA